LPRVYSSLSISPPRLGEIRGREATLSSVHSLLEYKEILKDHDPQQVLLVCSNY
jgi:hypothetical protein